MSRNAGLPTSAGSFATARRGGLCKSDIERAKADIGPRATPSMIARYLGCCVDDVQAILDLPAISARGPEERTAEQAAALQRRQDEDRDKVFIRLWCEGVTVVEIAEYFGVSTVTCHHWRVRLGLPTRLKASDGRGTSTPRKSRTCGAEARMKAIEVCNRYGLSLEDITSPDTRAKAIAWPRHHVMSVLVEEGYSTGAIGRFLGADHSTVIHGDQHHRLRQAWADFILWCVTPEEKPDLDRVAA